LVKTVDVAQEDLRTFMAIVVTSVTKGFFCYYGYHCQNNSVIGMVVRTHPKCSGLGLLHTIFRIPLLTLHNLPFFPPFDLTSHFLLHGSA